MSLTSNEDSEKRAFAAILVKEREPFRAALALFPDNTNRALWVATNWLNDPIVKAEKARILDEDAESILLSKVELLKDIEERMTKGVLLPNGSYMPPTHEEYCKLAKLYAEIRGMIEKPQTNVNVQTNVTNNVVEMPVFNSPEEWEVYTASQQRELLANARSRN